LFFDETGEYGSILMNNNKNRYKPRCFIEEVLAPLKGNMLKKAPTMLGLKTKNNELWGQQGDLKTELNESQGQRCDLSAALCSTLTARTHNLAKTLLFPEK